MTTMKHVYRVRRLSHTSDEVQRYQAVCDCGWSVVQSDEVNAMVAGRRHAKQSRNPVSGGGPRG